jgi:hypothetical protein
VKRDVEVRGRPGRSGARRASGASAHIRAASRSNMAASAAATSRHAAAAAAAAAPRWPVHDAMFLLRRLQEEGEGEAASSSTESGTTVSAGSSVSWQKPSTLVIIIGLSVTTALLIGLWLYRVTIRLANHARSIKVLDEIEMEFVNDDMDDVDEDEFDMRCVARALDQLSLPRLCARSVLVHCRVRSRADCATH